MTPGDEGREWGAEIRQALRRIFTHAPGDVEQINKIIATTEALDAHLAALKKRERVVLSGAMLKTALEFVAPDGEADQMESEVVIALTEARTSEDGDAMPAGYYCWLAEYPEEGCVPLFQSQE